MDINWNAVLTGFVTAFVIALLVALFVPAADLGWLAYSVPGLVGGFVAGYMVMGTSTGAVHGALATTFGAIILLALWVVAEALFAGLFQAFLGLTFGLLVLVALAIPGAITGALGAWTHGRRTATGERAGAQPR